jgi:hypothetical protein
MKRIACLAAIGLGLLPASTSSAYVAAARTTTVARGGYAHTSVNVSRTAVVHSGCCYGGVSPGAAVAGVAVGVAVGAAVGSAAAHSAAPVTTVAVGTIVPALPGGCTTAAINGVTYYQCSGVYYRPYYQGTTLVYQVSQP